MENWKNERFQKCRHSDTSITIKSFIDPSEFPSVDTWANADANLLDESRRSSLHPASNFKQEYSMPVSKNQRQISLGGITDSSMSSGFASDLSSATASTRFPSFSLASMESLETMETTWLNSMDPNSLSNISKGELSKVNKRNEGPNAQKIRRFVDARQRSGSMAASTASSNIAIDKQNTQRSMSFSVPSSGSGMLQLNSKGNIFKQRKDFSVFENLQTWKRNGYFIQLEDDSCTGNEDTRSFVLSQLTIHGASELPCIACNRNLPVYDHFPLLDGTLFLSPLCHRGGLPVSWNVPIPPSTVPNPSASGGQILQTTLAPPPGCIGPRQQQAQQSHHQGYQGRRRASISQKRFLHAICMYCMKSVESYKRSLQDPTEPSPQIVCKFCRSPWNGSTLLIGGLYTYDLFACFPCCETHLCCKSCGLQPISPWLDSEDSGFQRSSESQNLHPLPYFSQYSQLICCQHCRLVDYHFIKSFDDAYEVLME